MGIMMLAMMSLYSRDSLHRMNALKTALTTLISGTAVLAFCAERADCPAAARGCWWAWAA